MLTEGSSVVLAFPPPDQPTGFAQTSRAWLQHWQAHDQLTHADRALVTQVYLGFNVAHFKQTGELLAWPGWEGIATRAGLSEPSIWRAFQKLERLGALKIIRGGRDKKTGWKLPNEYRAISPPDFTLKGGHLSSCKKTTFQDERRLGESDSVNLRTKKDWNPRKQGTETKEERRRRWLAEGKSELTGIPKKTPANGRPPGRPS